MTFVGVTGCPAASDSPSQFPPRQPLAYAKPSLAIGRLRKKGPQAQRNNGWRHNGSPRFAMLTILETQNSYFYLVGPQSSAAAAYFDTCNSVARQESTEKSTYCTAPACILDNTGIQNNKSVMSAKLHLCILMYFDQDFFNTPKIAKRSLKLYTIQPSQKKS